jgi:hypothetical protein
MPYRVGLYKGVKEQLKTLAILASLAGFRQAYFDALHMMAQRLQEDPIEWGDPLYRKPQQNGVVCRASVGPIIVHYSVHESVNVVLIMRIEPLFEWPIRP